MRSTLEVTKNDITLDMMRRYVAVHLTQYPFSTPKTWFQHFKADHFPRWLLSRFPVEWHQEIQHITINVGAVYPQFPEVYPPGVGEIRYSYYKSSPVSVYPQIVSEGEEDI